VSDDKPDIKTEVLSLLESRGMDELASYLRAGRIFQNKTSGELASLFELFTIKGLAGRDSAAMEQSNNIAAEYRLRGEDLPPFTEAMEAAMQRFADAAQEHMRQHPEAAERMGEDLVDEINARKAEPRN
jgi:hypothetical protein